MAAGDALDCGVIGIWVSGDGGEAVAADEAETGAEAGGTARRTVQTHP